MKVEELKEYLSTHQSTLVRDILEQNYLPDAIRGVSIPKKNGKLRLLGIPTVVDRFLQQAVSQILLTRFELNFSNYSYGFRKLKKRRKGLPQGSPLSPLLSNIMLDQLDKYLEQRGMKFIRYADDFSIYTKSKSEARSIGNEVYVHLRDKLELPINRDKSGIRRPTTFTVVNLSRMD